MSRIPVTNNTAMPIYVGANMVPPGETRDFEDWQVPEHLKPAPAAPEPVAEEAAPSSMEVLRAEPVDKILREFDEITDEQLDELEALEMADEKPRKSLIEAIDKLRLERASGE